MNIIISPDMNIKHTTQGRAISGRLAEKLLDRTRVGSGLVEP